MSLKLEDFQVSHAEPIDRHCACNLTLNCLK